MPLKEMRLTKQNKRWPDICMIVKINHHQIHYPAIAAATQVTKSRDVLDDIIFGLMSPKISCKIRSVAMDVEKLEGIQLCLDQNVCPATFKTLSLYLSGLRPFFSDAKMTVVWSCSYSSHVEWTGQHIRYGTMRLSFCCLGNLICSSVSFQMFKHLQHLLR